MAINMKVERENKQLVHVQTSMFVSWIYRNRRRRRKSRSPMYRHRRCSKDIARHECFSTYSRRERRVVARATRFLRRVNGRARRRRLHSFDGRSARLSGRKPTRLRPNRWRFRNRICRRTACATDGSRWNDSWRSRVARRVRADGPVDCPVTVDCAQFKVYVSFASSFIGTYETSLALRSVESDVMTARHRVYRPSGSRIKRIGGDPISRETGKTSRNRPKTIGPRLESLPEIRPSSLTARPDGPTRQPFETVSRRTTVRFASLASQHNGGRGELTRTVVEWVPLPPTR